MEEARSGRAPRQYERAQRLKIAVEIVDLVFQPLNLRVGHLQTPARVLGLVGKAEVGAEIEQIILNAREHSVEALVLSARTEARKPDGRVGLVERAVCL